MWWDVLRLPVNGYAVNDDDDNVDDGCVGTFGGGDGDGGSGDGDEDENSGGRRRTSERTDFRFFKVQERNQLASWG
ncbi:hypothetical protein PoB_007339100 [Plakobranchus ocellatus]|uniref:Uncharacterized protein n=1 Tax=Plakobranchus ocellatus TaxID=259542 RepID=A0AAV4DSK2_9GAST|nr:hypothetical protein PoB_007339100 [Plakobranchus ocellatus]